MHFLLYGKKTLFIRLSIYSKYKSLYLSLLNGPYSQQVGSFIISSLSMFFLVLFICLSAFRLLSNSV